MWTLAAFCTLLVAANAQLNQWRPFQNPACDLIKTMGGLGFLSHGTYCQLFQRCNTANFAISKRCPGELLWDVNTNSCNHPDRSKCEYWPCDNSVQYKGKKYPSICCNEYYLCTGTGFSRQNCGAGQVFNITQGECISSVLANACSNSRYCTESLPRVSSTALPVCSNAPDADPCKFQENIGGVTYVRLCGAGTQYNPLSCNCNIRNNECINDVLFSKMKSNKLFDAMCRASMRLDFGSAGSLATFSDKLSESLPYTYSVYGASVSNSRATLSPNSLVATPYLFSYFFANNQLSLPFAIVMEFCPTNNPAEGTSFDLFSNDYPGSCDTATIKASAVKTNTGWSFTQQIEGSGGVMYSTSGTLIASGNSCIRYLMQVGTQSFSFSAFNRGSSGTQNLNQASGNAVNVAFDNGFAGVNKCGLSIARGFTGNVNRFELHEGCGDFSLLVPN